MVFEQTRLTRQNSPNSPISHVHKEMDLNTVELQESFKRLSVPATHKNKVSRVYVKSSDANQTFQKETKPKLKM